MTKMTTMAILGAAGSMGTRASNALKDDPDYEVLFVEAGEQGEAKLRERGLPPTPIAAALNQAEVVIMAIPDALIGTVSKKIVPRLKSGAMLIGLDPAAPHAGRLPERGDVTYFFTHPAHPPVFNDETDPEARRDFFGSGRARQAIVCALVQGPEEDYVKGETIARKLFGPVLRAHRVSIEQMALLEPAMAETVAATCIAVIREAMDETIRRGVPAPAARDFLMGHINIGLAIAFDEIDWQLSAGAQQAVEDAMKILFRPDWKKVFEPENLLASTRKITEPR